MKKFKSIRNDRYNARESLREELDAINKYEMRIDGCTDKELKYIFQHNMDEEKDHVAMLIEWLQNYDETQGKMFIEHD